MWQKLRIREIDAAAAAAEESYLRFLHPKLSSEQRRGLSGLPERQKNE